jgi:archaellum biogenesis ATPase FlaH
MTSLLVVTPVERLQQEICDHLRRVGPKQGVYVCLNRRQASTDAALRDHSITTRQIHYVDCVSHEEAQDSVTVPPQRLDLLHVAISAYLKELGGERFLLIDSLATLLLYNNENKVAQFLQAITEHADKTGVDVLAFSPHTEQEELLAKIFNFFDKVQRP